MRKREPAQQLGEVLTLLRREPRSEQLLDVGGDTFELGPGGLVHVESTTPRQATNVGDDDLVLLIVGGKDGYVGRDAHVGPGETSYGA